MTEAPTPEPHLTPPSAKARAEREARQAAALRANLRRRKAQARERDALQGAQQEAGDVPPHSVYPNISDEH